MLQRWLNTRKQNRNNRRSRLPLVEALEARLVLSVAPTVAPAAVTDYAIFRPLGGASPLASSGPVGLQPTQVRYAYGFDQITFTNNGKTIQGDGTGQTIAIIDAYDDPNFVNSTSTGFSSSDLHQFDAALGIPDPPSFTKVNQSGGTSYPAVDSTGGWETEESLDVEWAHALAPGANILLVEANSTSLSDLNAAVNYARQQPGVSVVSMSYGGGEFSGETGYDSLYTTPSGHAGITFVAATGDNGAPSGYPAVSPNVLAVGGTTLSLSGTGNYAGESGWSGSGGGLSSYEAQPSYQHGVVTQSTTRRAVPDVSFDADPNSGVAVYDSYTYGSATPWLQVGGTSFAAPAWAALVAVADQGRAAAGEGTLDGASGTLPALYALPGSDFHDVTTGNNGYAAGPGYDLVTGRGSPVANLVAQDLVTPPAAPPVSPPASDPVTHFAVTSSSSSEAAGAPFAVTVTALDANNNPVAGYTGTVHFTSSDAKAVLPASYTFTAADAGSHRFSSTLKTAGTETLTVADSAAGVGGSESVRVTPGAATHFLLSAPASVTAGRAFTLVLTAQDAYNNTATNYSGTVFFQSTDSRMTIAYAGGGSGVFDLQVTLYTPGSQTILATDTARTSITGRTSTSVVSATAPAARIAVVQATTTQMTATPASSAAVAPPTAARAAAVDAAFASLPGRAGDSGAWDWVSGHRQQPDGDGWSVF